MDRFMALPRYAFTRGAVQYAPAEPGVFAFFDHEELIYVGHASDAKGYSICNLLKMHCDGTFGSCTQKATHYSWEITLSPLDREAEILASFLRHHNHEPRCQAKAA